MNENRPEELHILAPVETKPKLDYFHREVQRAAGRRIGRREALGLGGMALMAAVAAACGKTTTTGGSTGPSSTDALAGKPLESKLELYNWSQYDAKSTFTDFEALPDEAAVGMTTHETFYSSNDELLAKMNAGGAGTYDIVVPSQNAVAQLIDEGRLMALDTALLPNLANLDPSFLKSQYDPTGQFHVIKDYGISMFFYNNTIITDDLLSMHDFYEALPKYVSQGRTNILDGPEEVVPLALMALDLDPNTEDQADLDKVKEFLLGLRSGVTTISSYGYINDAIAGKIILSQGWNGDVRRIVEGRSDEGDITPIIPTGVSEIWSDNWCIPGDAPHPVAAHAWINWLLTPSTAVNEMNYHNYPVPIPAALSQIPEALASSPLFTSNIPKTTTDNYKYVLNVNPHVVQARTAIYTEFKAS
ncbi:MAG: spermidine/putrescine ABC transporter substrate-binding protein [Actinomycetota bacterium]|nr:spermidine/putrescine ABC transporter substrate-binding protein [Actinomycetota bacterium]